MYIDKWPPGTAKKNQHNATWGVANCLGETLLYVPRTFRPAWALLANSGGTQLNKKENVHAHKQHNEHSSHT